MRIALKDLGVDLSVREMRNTSGGHVYGGFLPVFGCTRKPFHLGFYNARVLFGIPFTSRAVCTRLKPVRFGFNNV